MVDLHSILASHKQKGVTEETSESTPPNFPTASEIPDIFFDSILIDYKLSRVDIVVLIYLYRKVWCRPNLYQKHGISQLMSLTDMVNQLDIKIEEIHNCIRKLENFGFISTIRVGQYFVRKFFSKELDDFYGQTYDDFDV
ncbi:MAG: hypothetical protein VX341_06920 [Bdellovibrionota bacterium]|nr:hypothetical protein [Bdellovibrionota bacterium]|tara:strand:- start:233 stop:652 length:420 start_codon:yes stop_codon:yes gene_type:complete